MNGRRPFQNEPNDANFTEYFIPEVTRPTAGSPIPAAPTQIPRFHFLRFDSYSGSGGISCNGREREYSYGVLTGMQGGELQAPSELCKPLKKSCHLTQGGKFVSFFSACTDCGNLVACQDYNCIPESGDRRSLTEGVRTACAVHNTHKHTHTQAPVLHLSHTHSHTQHALTRRHTRTRTHTHAHKHARTQVPVIHTAMSSAMSSISLTQTPKHAHTNTHS